VPTPRRRLLLVLLAGNCVYGQRLLADVPAGATPAPDVPRLTADSAPNVPKIVPNGIIALFGEPQVLFKVSATSAPEQSFLLSVGDRRAGIEVKKIDAKAGVITFDNHGVIQKLTLVTGTAWSSAQIPGSSLASANNPQNPNPHRLVRQMDVADDPRRQVVPDEYQVGTVDGTSGFALLPSGGLAEPVSQPVDNSQKLAATGAAYPSTATSSSQSDGLGTPASGGGDENLTPAELIAREIIAGGDVPPPPPANGN